MTQLARLYCAILIAHTDNICANQCTGIHYHVLSQTGFWEHQRALGLLGVVRETVG
jgi:hypothetical protein